MSGAQSEPKPPGVAEYFPFAAPGREGLARMLRVVGLPRPGDGVRVDDAMFETVFGPWRVATMMDNVVAAEIGGPYDEWKVLGARLSLADRGLTFGTAPSTGVCIRFRKPVPGLEPIGLLHHPSLTVTVAHPQLLARRLRHATGKD